MGSVSEQRPSSDYSFVNMPGTLLLQISLCTLLVSHMPLSSSVYLPPFTPPLAAPSSQTDPSNSLTPAPTRGPYEYQGRGSRWSRGWVSRYVDSVWGEQSG